MHKSNMHAALTIAAIVSTSKTAPSYAFTLTDTSAPLIQLGDYTDEPEPVLEPDGLISLDAMGIGM